MEAKENCRLNTPSYIYIQGENHKKYQMEELFNRGSYQDSTAQRWFHPKCV